jgi:hypothetical protein
MNDAQTEIERLREEVAELRKALGEKRQQLSAPNLPSLRDNYEFVLDCARYSEGLATEAAVRKKYHFDESTWESLGKDDTLVERIEAEKVRRVRDGSFKREKAQQLIVKGPEILDGIMSDIKTSPKHKVDAIKTLDALAANGPGAAPEQDRVVIRIDLTKGGGDVIEFNRSVRPTPSDDKLIEHDSNTPGLPGFVLT